MIVKSYHTFPCLLRVFMVHCSASTTYRMAYNMKEDSFLDSYSGQFARNELTEKETRELIDKQLRQVGWEANTKELRYSNGTRPAKGRNMAIAE